VSSFTPLGDFTASIGIGAAENNTFLSGDHGGWAMFRPAAIIPLCTACPTGLQCQPRPWLTIQTSTCAVILWFLPGVIAVA